ncbi:MAG: hypothetical protein JHC81_04995 [Brevundimonas sp.]|uniref:Mom family adenine methylcarbamoylation protein n=1 Tax=Brevundimonas sp. TaxID=1871086 RepID=UPI001A2798DE|nr:hypothetical protein [Brevundimonas sp.]MBJ7446872.1 hypothetical protein [Brevundimonas sp.]
MSERKASAPAYLIDQLALFGAAPVIGFGSPEFQVREIHRDRANAIIRRHHYSHKIVNNAYVHLGVFIDGDCYGVLQFGYAMNPASAGSVVEATGNDEYLELNRMWLDDFAPRNSESRAVSYAIRYIRRAWPKVRWIQSFADERCGLNGTVYQACNFDFAGGHVSTFWELDGEMFHNIAATTTGEKGGPRSRWLRDNLHRATRHDLRQFRYLFFLKPRFRKGLRLTLQPYPKAIRPGDAPATSGCEPSSTLGDRSNHSDGFAPAR